jgi:DNA-binding transcriptional ArsR family regulator
VTSTATKTELDDVFNALASEHRRAILRLLSESTPQRGKTCCAVDEVCGCKLSEYLGLSPSTISHHMSVLRNAGLVSGRNEGTWTYYTLQRDVLSAAAEVLTKL